MFLFVNRNYLIDKVENFDSYENAIRKLQYETIERTIEYNKNIYVISLCDQNKVYNSDGIYIYMEELNKNILTIIYSNKKIKYINIEYWLEFTNNTESNINDKINTEINKNEIFDENKQMNIFIKEKKNNSIKFVDNKYEITNNFYDEKSNIQEIVNTDETNIYNEKKQKLLEMIEEVNQLYQKELSNIKKQQLNLKSLDNKLKKLEKKQKDEIINNLIKTQGEYRTWKKIKFEFDAEDDEKKILKPIEELVISNKVIPVLFLSKYNYLDKIQLNKSVEKLLDEINKIDLNEFYSCEKLPDERIIKFCNKYMEISKELHYKFNDHEWDYLENEMNLNSRNKLSSNYITSAKIQ